MLISGRPVVFELINANDAAATYQMKLVTRWPERPLKPVRTATLRGSIIDDSTGCAVRFARVIVLGTKLTTYSDADGRFEISHVPIGRVSIEACFFGYKRGHIVARVPGDSIAFRLEPDPRDRFTQPCR